ncbi:M23 family metallopeptidase [Polyangium mundeleinium]|uniref:M23 family metallopeptidase n=1 Tax=Polyangium mundeleinium TaxID=2995306 RepID=A0ABT5EE52_9BACT|nr:M23 family metallopeptidase [Polyangium mundeleinium]MDC0740083.1 M23 family metallopeptidase [Polyangium mundeleinium]
METHDPDSSRRSIVAVNVALGCVALLGVAWIPFFCWSVSLERDWARAAGERTAATPSAIPAPPRSETVTPEHEQVGSLVVGSSGPSAALGSLDDAFLDEIDDTLGSCLPDDDHREGATIRLVADKQQGAADAGRDTHILALEYRPPVGEPSRFYEFVGHDAQGYYDATGTQACSTGWRSPLAKLRRTSPFNPRRMHPILRRPMPHQGTDFGAPKGTPVYASYRGTVSFVGPHGAHGNWVAIVHPDGTETGYAHLSKFAQGLEVGDHVRPHQLIGYVGSTGRSTGPHLHFSARTNGPFVDAESLLKPPTTAVPEAERHAFLKAKAELDQRLDAVPPLAH